MPARLGHSAPAFLLPAPTILILHSKRSVSRRRFSCIGRRLKALIPAIASSGSYGIFNVRMDVGTVIPNSGPVRFGNDFNAVPGSFGGEKATNSSPPTYFCSSRLRQS